MLPWHFQPHQCNTNNFWNVQLHNLKAWFELTLVQKEMKKETFTKPRLELEQLSSVSVFAYPLGYQSSDI